MKKKITTLFALISMLGFTGMPELMAQGGVYNNMESGDINTDGANCWGFTGISYSNAAPVISGSYSGRTEELTTGYANPKGIISPWVRLVSSVSVNFSHRQISNSFVSGAWRKCYLLSQKIQDTTTYNYDTLYTYNYTISGTQVEYANINLNAFNNQTRKFYFLFAGAGGNERCVIDDISFNGNYSYASDPLNNCQPAAPPVDTDGDGMGDNDDAFPNDQYRALSQTFPQTGYGTILFEDLWPSKGDYDFNDLVANYRITLTLNANMELVTINFSMVMRAWGASNLNGFALQFDGIAPNKITSVSGMKNYPGSPFVLSSNGTEAAQTSANVVFVSDISKAVPASGGGGSGANTTPGTPFSPYDTTNILITFINNGVAPPGGTVNWSEFDGNILNPYLIVNQVRSHEIHMANMRPTDKMNMSLFGTSDDNSVPSEGRYYKTKDNLPWIIAIDDINIPYMKEKVDITSGYLKLIDWVSSDGNNYWDWYQDQEGYRDAGKFY